MGIATSATTKFHVKKRLRFFMLNCVCISPYICNLEELATVQVTTEGCKYLFSTVCLFKMQIELPVSINAYIFLLKIFIVTTRVGTDCMEVVVCFGESPESIA